MKDESDASALDMEVPGEATPGPSSGGPEIPSDLPNIHGEESLQVQFDDSFVWPDERLFDVTFDWFTFE